MPWHSYCTTTFFLLASSIPPLNPPPQHRLTPSHHTLRNTRHNTHIKLSALGPSAFKPEPLNPMESYFYHTNKKNGYGISGSAMRIGDGTDSNAPSKTFTIANLQRAAQQLQQNHPLLRSRIVLDKKGVPHFEQSQPSLHIPIQIIETEDHALWKRTLSEEIRQRIDPEQDPLIRFILIKNSGTDQAEPCMDLLHIYHHSVSDATSSIALIEEFLEIAHHLSADQEQASQKTDFNTAQTPKAVAEHNLESFRHFSLMRPKSDFLFHMSVRNSVLKPRIPAIKKVDSTPELSIIRETLSTAETKKLLQACRKHGTSINGALTAASIIACAQNLPAPTFDLHYMRVSSPVSLRNRLSPEIDRHSLGAYVSAIEQNIWLRSAKEPFWTLANKCRNGLADALNNREHEQFHTLIGDILKMLTYPNAQLADNSPSTLLINSMGRCELEGDIDWQAFSWATHMGSSTPGLAVYSITINGNLSLSTQSERFSQEQLQTIMLTLLTLLREASDEF